MEEVSMASLVDALGSIGKAAPMPMMPTGAAMTLGPMLQRARPLGVSWDRPFTGPVGPRPPNPKPKPPKTPKPGKA
jgi:hypothetical protein